MAENPSQGRTTETEDGETEEQELQWIEEESALTQRIKFKGKQPNLHFVPETGTSRPRGTTRHLIRSHARQKQNTTASRPRLTSSRNIAKGGIVKDDNLCHTAQERSASSIIDPELLALDLIRGLQIRKNDPFDSLPIAGSARVQSLLYHLDRVVRFGRGLPGPREGWLSFAISDSAVLDTVLYIAALDIAGLRGTSASHDILYYKGDAIRIINNRLRDTNQVATDGTIAAVASLAHLENLTGTAESARIHADGLNTMIKSRGGLEFLGSYGMPRRIVSWADTCTSILLHTKPRYHHVMVKIEGKDPNWGPYNRLALLYQSKLSNITGSHDLSKTTVDIYWELRMLSRLKEEAAYSLNAGEDLENIPFTDTADCLERRMVPLVQLKPLLEPGHRDLSIFALFGYAAFIHIFMFVRDCSKDLPFSHLLSSRIRMLLETTNRNQLETQYPEMMLWIYLMGGLSGSPSSERVWFAEQVASFCIEVGLSGGDQIASMLEDFLWSELYRSPVTRRFWDEVAKKQGCKGYEVRRLADQVSFVAFNAPPDFDD